MSEATQLIETAIEIIEILGPHADPSFRDMKYLDEVITPWQKQAAEYVERMHSEPGDPLEEMNYCHVCRTTAPQRSLMLVAKATMGQEYVNTCVCAGEDLACDGHSLSD